MPYAGTKKCPVGKRGFKEYPDRGLFRGLQADKTGRVADRTTVGEDPREVIADESTPKSLVRKRGFKEYPDRGSFRGLQADKTGRVADRTTAGEDPREVIADE